MRHATLAAQGAVAASCRKEGDFYRVKQSAGWVEDAEAGARTRDRPRPTPPSALEGQRRSEARMSEETRCFYRGRLRR